MRIAAKKRYLTTPYGVLFLLAILILVAPVPVRGFIPTERYFRVEASQFAYSPSVLKVNPGDRVTIELVSQDVVHGLSIDGYDLEIKADPGETHPLSFTAGRSGSFRFRCSATCGSMHPFMIGKLQVGGNTALWRGAGLALLLVVAAVWRQTL